MNWRQFIGRRHAGETHQPMKRLYTLWCHNCGRGFEAEARSVGQGTWLQSYCAHCGKPVYSKRDVSAKGGN